MAAGRPLQHQPDVALTAAMDTFWRLGYHHASLRDLLKAMGISRSSLYQLYGNKEALFLAVLGRYRKQLLDNLAAAFDQAPSAWAFIESLLTQAALDAQSEQAALGCLIFNSATELGGETSLPAQTARECVDDISGFFAEVIARAQREGSISADYDPASTAQFLTLSMSGLRLLLKSGATTAQAQQTVKHILQGLR
ncbi:TetR/AcrR family transcriptional regulator [Vreelandella massiliensis]|uniref:TetR/AcrR family transcriptional regulator n=1 Tax=Vreelandella massiliensis TaxID=1816686 RepID=UPI00096A9987|nr:TetR/AcrR family transcriptional regulator [Halomonas massiliensis]MYL23802.1 TetR family transcriptional regulator [Halomonas alkaliantarctica]